MSVYISAMPKIELNESRRIVWDRICDELDVYDNPDLKIQEMKDLKEWYTNPRGPQTRTHCIASINLSIVWVNEFCKYGNYGDICTFFECEDYSNTCKIQSLRKIYKWLEQEVKEDARMANVLDLTKAKRFLEDEGSVNLSEMASITEEAAKMLSTYGGKLDLSGLADLSEKAAEIVSEGEYEGE
jgi:hypothetical protein